MVQADREISIMEDEMEFTKQQKKEIKRLARLRRNAGERTMYYDSELLAKLQLFGVDREIVESKSNSMFLITEPHMCEDEILSILEG